MILIMSQVSGKAYMVEAERKGCRRVPNKLGARQQQEKLKTTAGQQNYSTVLILEAIMPD